MTYLSLSTCEAVVMNWKVSRFCLMKIVGTTLVLLRLTNQSLTSEPSGSWPIQSILVQDVQRDEAIEVYTKL